MSTHTKILHGTIITALALISMVLIFMSPQDVEAPQAALPSTELPVANNEPVVSTTSPIEVPSEQKPPSVPVAPIEPPLDSVPPSTPPPSVPPISDGCLKGGCSGQLCTDSPDMVSTCEWREEYACYKDALCERQPSGKCGWTPTPALTQCLNTAQ